MGIEHASKHIDIAGEQGSHWGNREEQIWNERSEQKLCGFGREQDIV